MLQVFGLLFPFLLEPVVRVFIGHRDRPHVHVWGDQEGTELIHVFTLEGKLAHIVYSILHILLLQIC